MKIRSGFVSNSSTSSFIICKRMITNEQLDKLILFSDKHYDIIHNEDYLIIPQIYDSGELDNFLEVNDITNNQYIFYDN